MNIPMEAFQGFCRAKTNFYVFQKPGGSVAGSPKWFRDNKVWVSNAQTIGLNKDGLDLYVVDASGRRSDEIDDKAILDVDALLDGRETMTSGYVDAEQIASSYVAVPTFSGDRSESALAAKVSSRLRGFRLRSLGDLIDAGELVVRNGHGSPSADVRTGVVPYIKVSDLRAGRVNPNSTNMVPLSVAERFWRGTDSGIRAWDVVTPSRASKNIGEPCMVMPGQERIVLTKETLVLRAGDSSTVDPFYLFWALSLHDVRSQWRRVIFMQTNREDLGDRYRLVEIPYTDDPGTAHEVSRGYREYFQGLDALQRRFDAMSNDI